MSVLPQAIAPNSHTNLLNVYIQIANKMRFKKNLSTTVQLCFTHLFYSSHNGDYWKLKILNSSYDLFLIISYFKKTLFHKFPFSEMFAFFKDQIVDLEGWYMVALLESGLGFAINCCWAANFDLSSLSVRLRISLLSGKSTSYLLLWRALQWRITFFFWQGYWGVAN
jgi:hypothetical protein